MKNKTMALHPAFRGTHSTIILAFIGLSNFANAQNVSIPDANFKAALVSKPSINTNGDLEIQVSEAVAFTGTINVEGMSIFNLTGIEAFTGITNLNCKDNFLTSLDVSANTALNYLYCWNNQLTSLDVSSNVAIADLECNNNQLTSIDVSACTSLTGLECKNNQLTNLNLKNGNNTNLIYFETTNNPSLACIQVDNANYMNSNWASGKDTTASFNVNCNITGFSNLSNDDVIIVYPNPSSGIFTVNLKNTPIAIRTVDLPADKAGAKIFVYDILGNCILKKDCKNETNAQINLSTLSKGIYFMQMDEGSERTTKKIIIE